MDPKGSLPCSQQSASGPYPKPIQFTPSHPVSPRSSLILSFHLFQSLPLGLFPSGFRTKNLYAFLISPIRATRYTHLILLDSLTLIIFGEAHKLWSSSLGSLLQPPATASLLGPNILLCTLVSKNLYLYPGLYRYVTKNKTQRTRSNIHNERDFRTPDLASQSSMTRSTILLKTLTVAQLVTLYTRTRLWTL